MTWNPAEHSRHFEDDSQRIHSSIIEHSLQKLIFSIYWFYSHLSTHIFLSGDTNKSVSHSSHVSGFELHFLQLTTLHARQVLSIVSYVKSGHSETQIDGKTA